MSKILFNELNPKIAAYMNKAQSKTTVWDLKCYLLTCRTASPYYRNSQVMRVMQSGLYNGLNLADCITPAGRGYTAGKTNT